MAPSGLLGLALIAIICLSSTITAKPQFGIGSNLSLGKLGTFGTGFNFSPGPKLGGSSTTTKQQTPAANQDQGDVGLNTNLGLGGAGSIGSGFNFKPGNGGSTNAPQETTTTGNGIGISSNIGLGPLGSFGSGFNFQTPATTARTTTFNGLRQLNASTDSNETSSTVPVVGEETSTLLTTTLATTVVTTEAPKWSNWTEWSTCTVSCGVGHMKRNRTCIGGKGCFGFAEEQRPCFNKPCPVGEWTEWSNWTDCSANCGVGTQIRTRTCNNGTCFGPSEMRQSCHLMPCPVGTWAEWGEWSNCTTSCGFGLEKRTRVCNGGVCPGLAEMTRPCPFKAC